MDARTERKAVRFKALVFFFVCALATAFVYALKCSLHSGTGAQRTSLASATLRKSSLWSRLPRNQREQHVGPFVCSMTMAPTTIQSTGGPGKRTSIKLPAAHTSLHRKYLTVCRSDRHRRAVAGEDA